MLSCLHWLNQRINLQVWNCRYVARTSSSTLLWKKKEFFYDWYTEYTILHSSMQCWWIMESKIILNKNMNYYFQNSGREVSFSFFTQVKRLFCEAFLLPATTVFCLESKKIDSTPWREKEPMWPRLIAIINSGLDSAGRSSASMLRLISHRSL